MTGKEDSPTYTRIFQVRNFCCLFTTKAYQKAESVADLEDPGISTIYMNKIAKIRAECWEIAHSPPQKRCIYIYI